MSDISAWRNKPPAKEAVRELLALPLEDKLAYTCANISEWDAFTGGNWYVAFSGGKDSAALLYIAAGMLNRMPVQPHSLRVLFCDTGLEYPEIRKFVPWYVNWLSGKFPRVTIDYARRRPKRRFDQVIREYGYPVISKVTAYNIWQARNSKSDAVRYLRIMGIKKDGTPASADSSIPLKYRYLLKAPYQIGPACCDKTKKAPADQYALETGGYPVTAQMAMEGRSRYRAWRRNGCNAYEGRRPQSKPMSFWTEQDVLRFIVDRKIPICSVYGGIYPFDGEDFFCGSLLERPLKCTGCQRTGCVFCGFGAHLEKGDDRRFARLRRTHPKHWNYAVNGGEWDPADGMWKPSRTPGHVGLGLARVLDFIEVEYC